MSMPYRRYPVLTVTGKSVEFAKQLKRLTRTVFAGRKMSSRERARRNTPARASEAESHPAFGMNRSTI
jgi:hypothetical protein